MTKEDTYVSSNVISSETLADKEQFSEAIEDLSDEEFNRLKEKLFEAHEEVDADTEEVLEDLEAMLDEVSRLHELAEVLNDTNQVITRRIVTMNVREKIREIEDYTEES